MRRGFEMRLLLGEEMHVVSLGIVPTSKIDETIALLFGIGAVMDDDGKWYEPDAVAFFAFEETPCVVVVCKADQGGGNKLGAGAAQPGAESESGDELAEAVGPDLAEMLTGMEGVRLN